MSCVSEDEDLWGGTNYLPKSYLSRTASFVFYSITCLNTASLICCIALATFEEHMCQTSSVGQVAPLKTVIYISIYTYIHMCV